MDLPKQLGLRVSVPAEFLHLLVHGLDSLRDVPNLPDHLKQRGRENVRQMLRNGLVKAVRGASWETRAECFDHAPNVQHELRSRLDEKVSGAQQG